MHFLHFIIQSPYFLLGWWVAIRPYLSGFLKSELSGLKLFDLFGNSLNILLSKSASGSLGVGSIIGLDSLIKLIHSALYITVFEILYGDFGYDGLNL